MVNIGNISLDTLIQQLQKLLVAVVSGFDNVVVEHQVITGSVAHQDNTVSVGDIASGGFHTGQGGVGLGVIGITLGLDDLHGKQLGCIQKQNQCGDQDDHNSPESAYSFHSFPPILPME